MRYYPLHVDIRNRHCLVVGGGLVGTRKALTLLDCGANVTVICPQPCAQLREIVQAGVVQLKERRYRSADLDGMFLVIGATDDERINQEISRDALKRNILCNIADRPEACNFILPSIVRRGDLVVTISTSGKSPALAKRLRQALEDQFGEEYDLFLQLMGAIRRKLLNQSHRPQAPQDLFNRLIDKGLLEMIRTGRKEEINRLLRETLGDGFSYEALLPVHSIREK